MTRRPTTLSTLAALVFGSGILSGCYGGELSDSLNGLRDRDLSGVSGPSDRNAAAPVEFIPRAVFGTALTTDALTFPSAMADEQNLFSASDPSSPLSFFMTSQSEEAGVGPMLNQSRCAGCHNNASDNRTLSSADIGATLVVESPMTRAGRTAVTDHALISPPARPPTSAYAMFGDYFVAENRFDPLELFGGPIRHLGATEGCFVDVLPDPAADANLSTGAIRQLAERAAPSYVGRGLIEAIYAPDIEARQDPDDRQTSLSTLTPPPSCKGDCIAGRANFNAANIAYLGGDPVVRVARFGLRASATTLVEPVAAGAQQHLGMTHPYMPQEEQNPFNAGISCDASPDPELSAEEVLRLREMVRGLAPPQPAQALLQTAAATDADADIQAGARLFGVDLDAFRTRLTTGATPTQLGDADADLAIAVDRQLNCVGCHTPVMLTGTAPAGQFQAALSNRWVPLFSDLLIHDMGSLPIDRAEGVLEATHPFFAGVDRVLADFVLHQQGVATGPEWRTAPLLGFGLAGPPYLHDARVFINPSAPTFFFYGSRTADEAQLSTADRKRDIVDTRSAIRAAIELHDLPQPPDLNLDGVPDYARCPSLGPENDWCSRNSRYRSEARNVMEKWHALSDEAQFQVIAFLLAL